MPLSDPDSARMLAEVSSYFTRDSGGSIFTVDGLDALICAFLVALCGHCLPFSVQLSVLAQRV